MGLLFLRKFIPDKRCKLPKTTVYSEMNGTAVQSARFPSATDAGNSATHNGFKITTQKSPILKAEPIEQMTAMLGITPPEMIFGDNMASVEHLSSGWGISFNTFDALDRVDKTGGSMLQVAHSKEWQSTRYAGLADLGMGCRAEEKQRKEA